VIFDEFSLFYDYCVHFKYLVSFWEHKKYGLFKKNILIEKSILVGSMEPKKCITARENELRKPIPRIGLCTHHEPRSSIFKRNLIWPDRQDSQDTGRH